MAKYLRQNKTKGTWEIHPPIDAIKAGIARRETFDDEQSARRRVNVVIRDVNAFRRGNRKGSTLDENNNVYQLVNHYLHSVQFSAIKSQSIYETYANDICETPYRNKKFGEVKLKNITSAMCSEIYSTWSKQSIPTANYKVRIFSVLMKFAMAHDCMQRNPMAVVKKVQHTPASYVWTRQQALAFIEECFKDFKYRSLGLLTLMCYEWAQRPTDIANLKWKDIKGDHVQLKQSKRGAEVFLPIDDDLRNLLKQQKELYDFQELVVPYKAADGKHKPYTGSSWSKETKIILKRAGLPSHLSIGFLRKTAITEMREAGLDQVAIRNLTGHKSLSSLDPYMVNTLKSAEQAQQQRKKSYDV